MGFSNSVTGWLYIANYNETTFYEVFVEEFLHNPDWKQTISHNAGGTNFNVPVGIFWINAMARNVWISDDIDFEAFMADIVSWQEDQFFYIGMYKNAAKNFLKLDGTRTKYKVKIPDRGFGQTKKVSKGDEQLYLISTLKFEEAA